MPSKKESPRSQSKRSKKNPELVDAFRRERNALIRARHKKCLRVAAIKAVAAPAQAQGESVLPSIERVEPEPVSWKGTALSDLGWSTGKTVRFEREGAPSPEPPAHASTQGVQGAYCVTVPEVSPPLPDLSHFAQFETSESSGAFRSADEEDWYDWSMFRPSFSFRSRTSVLGIKRWRPWEV